MDSAALSRCLSDLTRILRNLRYLFLYFPPSPAGGRLKRQAATEPPLTPSQSYFFGHGGFALTVTVSPLRNFSSALTVKPPFGQVFGKVP